jgi:transmembrane sensor
MSEARRIEAEAASWLSRRVDPSWSEDDQAELDQWLDERTSHKAAYWRLEEGWEQAGRMAALGPFIREPKPRWHWSGGRWQSMALAASLAVVAFLGINQLRQAPRVAAPEGQVLATKVGGHKIVPLEDGSSIELNTSTIVRATVSSERREVWLERGEAFFNVLHSPTVPFVVHAGPKTVTVLGTRFSVRRDGDKVIVAVESGRVRVTDAMAPVAATETYVAAGSIAVTKPDATLITQSAPQNVEADLAWRQGQLIFHNDTLAEAAAEFNRYNERKVVIIGNAAELKISGGFQATNEEGFGRLLRDAYGLNVTADEKEVRVTE